MSKLRFENFWAHIFTDYIALIPTVIVRNDSPLYMCRSFAIEFHFLMFHMRWLWLEEGR